MGKLRRYELSAGEEEGDLMNLAMRHKDEIDALIEERVQKGPCKFQINVDVSMIKFVNNLSESGDGEVRSEKTIF